MCVHRLPVSPTPLVSFTVDRLGLDGGIMVTGSHLPPDRNGFKPMLGGDPLYGDALGELWTIEAARRPGGSVEPTGQVVITALPTRAAHESNRA